MRIHPIKRAQFISFWYMKTSPCSFVINTHCLIWLDREVRSARQIIEWMTKWIMVEQVKSDIFGHENVSLICYSLRVSNRGNDAFFSPWLIKNVTAIATHTNCYRCTQHYWIPWSHNTLTRLRRRAFRPERYAPEWNSIFAINLLGRSVKILYRNIVFWKKIIYLFIDDDVLA